MGTGNAVPIIVLTGGPCAGKTTAISHLQQKLFDLGYTVITVPEAATEFILSGLKPDTVGSSEFQRQLLEYIIERENRWVRIAGRIKSDKKVIICDRGVMDASAYITEHEFDLMLGELGYSVVQLRDMRYTGGVIFLQSVAVDVPHIYTTLNNSARMESVDEAKALDARTLAAWTGHPHLRIVDNSTDLDGKVNKVLQHVCGILGIPVPLEIERKYLVSSFDISKLPRPVQQVQIVQYYLNSEPGSIERIRSRGQNGGYVYYHTIKKHIRSGVRSEIESQITREEYYSLLRRADPEFARIEKTRFCFVWKNQYFELDLFQNPAGLTLLEIELTEENDRIDLPDFLQGKLLDVTDDPTMSNAEIARATALQD